MNTSPLETSLDQAAVDNKFADIIAAEFPGDTAAPLPSDDKSQKGVVRRLAEAYWAGLKDPEMSAARKRVVLSVGEAAVVGAGIVKVRHGKMSLHQAGIEMALAAPEEAAAMGAAAALKRGVREVFKPETWNAYKSAFGTAQEHFRQSGSQTPSPVEAPATADFGPAATATEPIVTEPMPSVAPEQLAPAMSEQRFVGRAAVPPANLARPLE